MVHPGVGIAVYKYLSNRFLTLVANSDELYKRLSEIVSRYHSPTIFREELDR